MNKENIPVITDREKIYDKCENMEQLFDNYYLPLLDKHYSKTYELQRENQSLKEQVDYLRRSIERKEETIIDLEQERVPYTNEYVEELQKELNEENLQCSKYAIENQDLKEQKLEWINLLNMFKNQQKEFIDDLTSNINLMKKEPMMFQESCIQCKLLEETLLKYKEITGHQDGQQSGQV